MNSIESFFRNADTKWWNPSYGYDNRFWIFKAQLEYVKTQLQKYIDIPQKITALDAGCGRGIHSQLLWNLGYRVTSFDINPSMLALTAKINQELILVQGSLMNMPFANQSFSVVVSIGTSMHVPLIITMINEIYRILYRGGIAVISIANKFSIYVLWTTRMNKSFVQHQRLYCRRQYNPWYFRKILIRQGFYILDSRGFAVIPPISIYENWKGNIINPIASKILSCPLDWLFGRYLGCGITFIIQKK